MIGGLWKFRLARIIVGRCSSRREEALNKKSQISPSKIQKTTNLQVITTKIAALALCMSAQITASAGHAPGPDAFGYTVQATTQFSFLQITNSGTSRVLWFNDDGTFTANIGFSFNFYGINYTNVSFNPNGLMTFGALSSNWFNVDLTTTSPSN